MSDSAFKAYRKIASARRLLDEYWSKPEAKLSPYQDRAGWSMHVALVQLTEVLKRGADEADPDTALTAQIASLKAALNECCDVADELGYGHGDIPAHRRIAQLRALAGEP